MSLEVVYAPLALKSMNEIADYLGGQSSQLGFRFLQAVEDTCAIIADTPEIAGRYESENPRLADVRVLSVNEFPNHLIFYRIKTSYLEIVHVIYGGRDLKNLM
jgi:plasmid stabilization system protein ParE